MFFVLSLKRIQHIVLYGADAVETLRVILEEQAADPYALKDTCDVLGPGVTQSARLAQGLGCRLDITVAERAVGVADDVATSRTASPCNLLDLGVGPQEVAGRGKDIRVLPQGRMGTESKARAMSHGPDPKQVRN